MQRFIRMLDQSFEYVGCETSHDNGDAAVLIIETTIGPEQRRAPDPETSLMCKECWDVQFATICCLSMPSSAVIQLFGYSA